MSGIVYILSHKAMPGLLKVGFTHRTIEERLTELSHTGVPGKFTAELYFEVDNPPLFENLLHKSLREFHFDKEFFSVDIKIAIKAIHALIDIDKLTYIKFNGNCSQLATTPEQIFEQQRVYQEKSDRAAAYAKSLKEKYINKSISELRFIAGYNPEKLPHYEIMQIYKIIKIIDNQAAREREKESRIFEMQAEKNFELYKAQYHESFKKLGLCVHYLLKNKAPKKIFPGFFGYTFADGVKLSKNLSQDEIKIFEKFMNVLNRVISLVYLGRAYKQIDVPEGEPLLIIQQRPGSYQTELSDYLKGAIEILK